MAILIRHSLPVFVKPRKLTFVSSGLNHAVARSERPSVEWKGGVKDLEGNGRNQLQGVTPAFPGGTGTS